MFMFDRGKNTVPEEHGIKDTDNLIKNIQIENSHSMAVPLNFMYS